MAFPGAGPVCVHVPTAKSGGSSAWGQNSPHSIGPVDQCPLTH